MEEETVRSELFVNHLATDRNTGLAESPIWFADEDIKEADYPYTQQLLAESFRYWVREADNLYDRDGTIVTIYESKGYGIASFGAADEDAAAGLFRVMEMAAGVALAEGRSEFARYEGSSGSYSLAAAPVTSRHEGRLVCALVAAFPSASSGGEEETLRACRGFALHFRSCFYRSFEHLFVKDMLVQQEMAEAIADRKETLFLATKRLHDQIDVTSVLNEIIQSLETLYPESHVDLFLSQDYINVDPRVKPLVFRYESDELCARAFLEGRHMTERSPDGTMRIAVPLSGKQAVYGVLQLSTRIAQWNDVDLPAFIMLADTAGSAFENAKLYEQSNLLIRELQLINELTKRLNQSLRLKEIYKFTTDELLKIFDADFSCLLQYNKESGSFFVVSCNVPSMDNEQFSAEYGFCGVVYRSREPLIVSDYPAMNSVPSKLMEQTNAKSLIASPVIVDGEVAAVILVAHRDANFFSYDNYKLLTVLSTHIGLAVANASLHAEVRRMVITDNLTGLHARHYLNEQIQQRQRKDACGSLILVDIDYFKQVNDTFGHQIGDRILTQVSEVIKSCIRETDIAARWGGEELAVYLPKIRTEQAFRIADRIRARVAAETDPVVTVSCGVSEWLYEDDKISVESLFYRADMALYDAKHNGRNRVYVG